jgi:hypothetical protein
MRVASGRARGPSNLAIDAILDKYDLDPETRERVRVRFVVKLVEAHSSDKPRPFIIKVVDAEGRLKDIICFPVGEAVPSIKTAALLSAKELAGLYDNAIVETLELSAKPVEPKDFTDENAIQYIQNHYAKVDSPSVNAWRDAGHFALVDAIYKRGVLGGSWPNAMRAAGYTPVVVDRPKRASTSGAEEGDAARGDKPYLQKPRPPGKVQERLEILRAYLGSLAGFTIPQLALLLRVTYDSAREYYIKNQDRRQTDGIVSGQTKRPSPEIPQNLYDERYIYSPPAGEEETMPGDDERYKDELYRAPGEQFILGIAGIKEEYREEGKAKWRKRSNEEVVREYREFFTIRCFSIEETDYFVIRQTNGKVTIISYSNKTHEARMLGDHNEFYSRLKKHNTGERKVNCDGRIPWKGRYYSVGKYRHGQTLTLRPYEAFPDSGFRAYDRYGKMVAYYDAATGETWKEPRRPRGVALLKDPPPEPAGVSGELLAEHEIDLRLTPTHLGNQAFPGVAMRFGAGLAKKASPSGAAGDEPAPEAAGGERAGRRQRMTKEAREFFSELVKKPRAYPWAEHKEELGKELMALGEFGETDERGVVVFEPYSGFSFAWPILGKHAAGWKPSVIAYGIRDGRYFQFFVELKQDKEKPIYRYFQVGLDMRVLPHRTQGENYTKQVLELIDITEQEANIRRSGMRAPRFVRGQRGKQHRSGRRISRGGRRTTRDTMVPGHEQVGPDASSLLEEELVARVLGSALGGSRPPHRVPGEGEGGGGLADESAGDEPAPEAAEGEVTAAAERLERYEKLERFVTKHEFQYEHVADGSVHQATPYHCLYGMLDAVQDIHGPLEGKNYLSFGAGDLRDSLVACFGYGMNVTAVEKDNDVSLGARDIAQEAERQGFSNDENLVLLQDTDALDISWQSIDVAYLFYTEPDAVYREAGTGAAKAKKFREKIVEKVKEMRPGGILAISFIGFQITTELDKFEGLDTVWSEPVQLLESKDGLFLQLYKAFSGDGEPAPDAAGGEDGAMPVPGVGDEIRDVWRTHEALDGGV